MGTIQTLGGTAIVAPATNAIAVFNEKATRVLAGWTVAGSSDGATFSNAGVDKWTTSAAVVANAWVRLKAPTGTSEEVIQYNGSTGIRAKWSEVAGFSGGSPSATQVPSATDEGITCGGGTDAAPTYRTVLPTAGTYHQVVYVDGAAAPYPHYCWLFPNAGGNPLGGWYLDAVDGTEVGETAPTQHYWATAGGSPGRLAELCQVSAQAVGQAAVVGWLFLDVPASKGFVTIPMLKHIDQSSNAYVGASGGGGVVSARTGKNPYLPIIYMRNANQTAPQGYKGTSRLFQWATVTQSTPGDVQIISAHDYQVAGDLLCKWVAASGAWA